MSSYGNVESLIIEGLNDEATLDGTTGDLGTDTLDTSRGPAGIIVFVSVTGHPD